MPVTLRIWRIRRKLLILTCLLIFPLFGHAAECPDAVPPNKATAKLQMIGIAYPPGKTFEKWLEKKSTKVTCEMFKRLGWTVKINYYPIRRAFAEMANGNADMMSGADYHFKPEVRCHLKLVPYRAYKLSAYYFDTQKRLDEPTKLEDFSGKVLAAATGMDMSQSLVKKAATNHKWYKAATHETQLHLLRLGRVDYSFHSANGAQEMIAKLHIPQNQAGNGRFFEVTTPVDVRKSGMVFNTNRPNILKLAEQFKLTLMELRNDGIFLSLTGDDPSYHGTHLPTSMVEKYQNGKKGTISNQCKSK